MKLWNNVFVAYILLCLLAGCSTNRDLIVPQPDPTDHSTNQDPTVLLPDPPSTNQDLIVLLPDPNGKVGKIRVTTRGGSQILDKPGYAAQVENSGKPPIAPTPIDQNEITDVFGAALSAQPDQTGRFILFILWFENDKTKPVHESKDLLREIVRTIKNRKSNEIYVVGHADRVGTDLYNIKLSSKRAYYVRDFLVSSGIKTSALVVSFYGKAKPLVYTEEGVAEPLNRRVEVIVR